MLTLHSTSTLTRLDMTPLTHTIGSSCCGHDNIDGAEIGAASPGRLIEIRAGDDHGEGSGRGT
jgi:hypothetical protein